MDDRELLEAAARAIGLPVILQGAPWPKDADGWFFNQVGDHPPALYQAKTLTRWAPLTDDGDALRLAVKLNLFAGPHFWHELSVQQVMAAMNGDRQDHYAATRRAILRAAAALSPQPAPEERQP